jgi:hypothetical protein
MGTHTVRGVSAFRPSDQTRGAIANSMLTAPSSSTHAQAVVATSNGMGPPTIPVNNKPESSDDDSMPPSTPI